MEPFVTHTKSRYEIIDSMYKQMIQAYKELQEYFCIDTKTSIGEFFTDIKTFCTQFIVS